VGAGRTRQGLGPFVARDLRAAGAAVPCFLARSAAGRDAAAQALREHADIDARGYLSLDAMLAAEPLDALAILSPSDTHDAHLAAAAEANLPVLCEKPLVWDVPDLAATAARRIEAFVARGLLLVENCQWPYALEAFEALHPGSLAKPPRRFEMLMQPASRGVQAFGDSLPHPISLLQQLLPGEPSVGGFWFSTREPAQALTLRFEWRTPSARCDVEVTLLETQQAPRRAELALDGRRAQRLVSPQDYRLCFADAERSVPLPDPLTRLVADFVTALRGGRSTQADPMLQRARVLAEIVAAYSRQEER
jgi:predicted dehydrogenase